MNCTAPQLLSSLTAPRRMSFRRVAYGNTTVQIIRYHTVGVNILILKGR